VQHIYINEDHEGKHNIFMSARTVLLACAQHAGMRKQDRGAHRYNAMHFILIPAGTDTRNASDHQCMAMERGVAHLLLVKGAIMFTVLLGKSDGAVAWSRARGCQRNCTQAQGGRFSRGPYTKLRMTDSLHAELLARANDDN
jgi:hypothetical protein